MNSCIDSDGNVIRKGMSVVSGGDIWVVGSVSPRLIRLDRHTRQHCAESRAVGRNRFCCVHVIGFQSPRVFTNGNNPYQPGL
jgi:hypothetical protein